MNHAIGTFFDTEKLTGHEDDGWIDLHDIHLHIGVVVLELAWPAPASESDEEDLPDARAQRERQVKKVDVLQRTVVGTIEPHGSLRRPVELQDSQ
jgi:hypothetical protein